jgi:hypothetical protein
MSLAIITPPAYLMASTDVPVTYGYLRARGRRAA